MNQLARLRWQCRRGTKELDLLLQCYLDSGYVVADEDEKAQFVELLELEADELVAVLMGKLAVDSVKIKHLLGKIRAFAVVEN
jgi:antitoxin CptB